MRTRRLLVSVLIGAAAAFLLFVLFLQTAAVSLVRLGITGLLFAAISMLHYWLATHWLAKYSRAVPKAAALGLITTAVFLPLLFPQPAFPLSPLLRPWADLAVQFEAAPGSAPLLLPQNGVKLIMGRQVLNETAFNLVGNWQKTDAGLHLAPGATGSLQWTGPVPDTVSLVIQPPAADCTLTIYWNNLRTSTQLHAGSAVPINIVEKVAVPWGYRIALFLSVFVLLAWAIFMLITLVGRHAASLERAASSEGFRWAVIILSVILAAFTVKWQVDSLSGGTQYIAATQLARHANVLQGHAPNPWQYRVLSEWIAQGAARLTALLPVPNTLVVAFVALRVFQNIAIFLLAFALYKRLACSNLLALLGLLLLTVSMANAYHDNDLSFNTYFDVLFYLLAGLLLLSRRYSPVVIVAFFAALNRETSGLIPFLMAATILEDNARPGLKKFAPALLALLLFAAVFFGLRGLYPDRPLYVPYKQSPGVPLLLYNVTRQFTWDQLWRTLGPAPLLGVAFLPAWPRLWKWFLLILCPIWFIIHSFASVMAETRLFLVPQALIFIPGVLFVLGWLVHSDQIAIPSLHPKLGAS